MRIVEYENKLPKQVIEFSFLAIQNFASEQTAAGDHALSRAEMKHTPEVWPFDSVNLWILLHTGV